MSNKIRVFVGTTNASKISCAGDAVAGWFPTASVACEGAAGIESGVHEQPLGFDETMQGAINRALNLRAKVLADAKLEPGVTHLFVGLESGIIVGPPVSGAAAAIGTHYDFCACAIALPESDAVLTGTSGGFALPAQVASAFGNPSSPTHRQYNPSFAAAGFTPDPTGPGVLAQCSANRLTRGLQMGQAVQMALVQHAASRPRRPEGQKRGDEEQMA